MDTHPIKISLQEQDITSLDEKQKGKHLFFSSTHNFDCSFMQGEGAYLTIEQNHNTDTRIYYIAFISDDLLQYTHKNKIPIKTLTEKIIKILKLKHPNVSQKILDENLKDIIYKFQQSLNDFNLFQLEKENTNMKTIIKSLSEQILQNTNDEQLIKKITSENRKIGNKLKTKKTKKTPDFF